jgi:hypothetical protein
MSRSSSSIVVAHDGISEEIDREGGCERCEPLFDPLSTVLEALPGTPILATQKRPSDASRNAVVVRRVLEADLLASCDGHGTIPWSGHI